MRMLSQRRSEFALKVVTEFYKKGSKGSKEFKSLSSSVPSMILQNGFGQTLSFLLARDKTHHKEIFNALKEWLVGEKILSGNDNKDFLLSLTGEGSSQKKYLNAQNEALLLLEWIKRYAVAFYKEEKKEK